MRDLIQAIYASLLRLIGLYLLFLVGWTLISLPSLFALAHSSTTGLVAVVFAVLSAGIGLVLVVPKWTPKFLGQPSMIWHLFPVLVTHGLLPIFFAILSFLISLPYDTDTTDGKTIAIMIAIAPILVAGLLWWVSLLLCVMPGGGSYTPPKRKIPQAMTPLSPSDGPAPFDARSLRKARMS